MSDTNSSQKSLKEIAVKGVAALSFQNIILQVIWFLTSLVLLNSVSVYDYSVMKLVLVAIAFPSALYVVGIDPIIQADMGVEREQGRMGVVKGLFRSYVIFEFVSAIVIWAGFVLGITFFKSHFLPITHQYLFAGSFMIFSRPLQNVIFQFFSLFFRFHLVTLLKVYDEGVTLIAMFVFVFYFKQGIYAAILIQVIAPFIAGLFSIPAFIKLYRKHFRGVKSEPGGFMARLRAHGKWSIAAAYVATGTDALHLFLIDRLVGREAVALYSLADSLWGHLTSLFPVKSILSAMMPQRSKDEALAKQHLIRGTKYAFVGFVLLGIAAAIGGYPFLRLLFPKYVAAFPVFLGLLFLIPRFSFASALGPLLRAYKFQKAGFVSSVTTLVLTGGLALVLYPVFGMKGIVAEVVISNTIFIYLVYRSFVKKYPVFVLRARDFFCWDAYDMDMLQMLLSGMKRSWKRK